MYKPAKLLLATGLLVAVQSCLRHIEPTEDPVSALLKQKFADDFNFKSTRDVQLNVTVGSAPFAGAKFRINVYDDFPTVGSRVTSGVTDENRNLKLEFRTPAPLQYLFVEKVDPYGASEVRKVAAADYTSADFKTATPTLTLRQAAPLGSGLDCTTGTTKTYNNFSGSLNVNNGEVIALTGTFQGGINMNGGTVRICGAAKIEWGLNMNNAGCVVYFLEGSTVTAGSLNLNAAGAKVYNYSDALTVSGSCSLGGNFENNGKMTVNGDLNLNNNGSNGFVNNGELTVASNLNNNRSFTNNNSLLVRGSYQANGGSASTNNCRMVVERELTVNTGVTNNGYIKASARTTINGGATLALANGALLSTAEVMCNGGISGGGSSKSTVKVTGRTTFNGGSSLSGNLTYCDENGVETNYGNIPKAFFDCSNYIATSACNPEGFGKPVMKDSDGDGIPDDQDDSPTDAAVATTSSYPSAGGWSTYGFEDQWPYHGDYDFNDLVLNFRVTRSLNASNQVVSLKMNLLVKAVGAAYNNGFGFQLDGVSSGDVASVTGYRLAGTGGLAANKTESGQSKAVIIAFSTPTAVVSYNSAAGFNVTKNGPSGAPGNLEIVVTFKNPIDQSRLAQYTINPFIYVAGNRGREVHLAGFSPTDKANRALMGTADDASGPGRYYKTANNLPWAIEVPSQFEHPVEKAPISSAYLYFEKWARSGGAQYSDWYQRKAGYVNNDLIF